MTPYAVDIYVLGGAFGDICAMLPLFRLEHQRTGMKTLVIVKKTYAPMFEGVSYCEPVIYDGQGNEGINGVVQRVKEQFNGDVAVHFLNPVKLGRNGEPVKRTSSFVTEMWRIVGRLDEYGKHPLVFDCRHVGREASLLTQHCPNMRPVVLVASDGRSAPFPYADALLEYLRDELPDCNVVDLLNVTADRPYDLLGLFDHAKILVTVDTMHLHLAPASSVPVAAFTRDDVMWKGSPWRPSHVFHARYSEFYPRAKELISVIRKCVDGEQPVAPITINGLFRHNYNPSIIRHQGKLLLAYRWHPDPGSCRTKIAIAELTEDFKIISNEAITVPSEIRALSVEDPRLFEFRGQLHISYTVSRVPQKPPFCVVQYGRLEKIEGSWTITEHHQPIYGKNDWTGFEKNHLFFELDEQLFCLYQSHDEQIVLDLSSEGTVIDVMTSTAPEWNWGTMHGGTQPLPYDDKHWIRFFHSRTMIAPWPWPWRYYVGAALMENKPPFRTVALSKEPLLVGNEGIAANYPCKPNVVFPSSAIQSGDDYLISFGENDCASKIVKITKKDIGL